MITENTIDPSAVPFRTLSTGAKVPAIGLGTFGSDNYDSETIAEAVVGAAEVGYRHFDCASIYGNEYQIGGAFERVIAGGVERSELWITSKVWNDHHGPGDVKASCLKSLSDLRLDYLDLYLVHWPFPNMHAAGVGVTSRDQDAKPYIHDSFMRTWGEMEQLVDAGLVRHIGTSNVTIPKLERILSDARIKPVATEMELHPHFQQPELFKYAHDCGMAAIGYCPIGSPSRPKRDRAPDDTVDIEDPVIVSIAARLGVQPAIVCVKWAMRRGVIPIPFSVKRAQYTATLQAAVAEPLTDADMAAIAGIDKNNRLVKGQVFLWKPNQSWEDLWDLNGTITAP